MQNLFHPFVLPFVLGTIILFAICIWKFIRWFRHFDRLQRAILRKNIFSWKIIPALWEAFREGLLHIRISRQNLILGYMHRSIAFGWFLLIVVGFFEAHLTPLNSHPVWLAIFYRFFIHEHHLFASSEVFTFIMDLLLLYVLSGIFIAFCKKIYSKAVGMKKTTKHVLFDHFAKVSLWAIFPLRLLSESLAANVYQNGGFLTQSIGNFFSPWFAETFLTTSWTMYSIALGTFFVALPFSRYMHIFTEIILIYFRQMGVHEHLERTGYTMYELNACSRCGICIDNCPLNKDLNITNVQPVYFLRDLRYKRGTDAVADNCLLCGRCDAACPVNIDLLAIRQQERNKREQDHCDYSYLNNIQPFNAIGRVGFFGGCMSHLTPGITESMKAIFEEVEQKYWFLDEERTICCGRPLMQQGYLEQAAELRRKNSELIKKSKISVLITSCPICYQSFKNEYKLSIPIMHHTEYIMKLLETGKLKLRKDDLRTVYHDPCELGRGCGIYKEPRQILKKATHLVKAKHEKEESICCGINLGDTLIDIRQQTQIRDAAMNNLMYKNPDQICTACPMCKRAFNHATDFPVKDIAEIVRENMIKK
ncbi:MAG: 4Fe-4S dicluster domain-containing protein [Bacteroidales bacterium]|jgi:Fe-S oxidoreductase|nr:4Fe-4S dicluster domain-containing protein [Bacteroidales bacterium]